MRLLLDQYGIDLTAIGDVIDGQAEFDHDFVQGSAAGKSLEFSTNKTKVNRKSETKQSLGVFTINLLSRFEWLPKLSFGVNNLNCIQQLNLSC